MFKQIVVVALFMVFLSSCTKSKQDMIKLTAENYHVNLDQVKLSEVISNDPGGVGVYVWQANVNDKMVVCSYFPNFMLEFNYSALKCSAPNTKKLS